VLQGGEDEGPPPLSLSLLPPLACLGFGKHSAV